jgi:hypothetical protein
MPVNGATNGNVKGKKRVASPGSSDQESDVEDGNVNGNGRANGRGESSSKRRRLQHAASDEEEEEERPGMRGMNGHRNHVNGNGKIKPRDIEDEDEDDDDDDGASGEDDVDDEEGLEVEQGQRVRTQRPAVPMQNLVRHDNGYAHTSTMKRERPPYRLHALTYYADLSSTYIFTWTLHIRHFSSSFMGLPEFHSGSLWSTTPNHPITLLSSTHGI